MKDILSINVDRLEIGENTVLEDIHLQIDASRVNLILGATGVGKTLLLKTLLKDIEDRPRYVGEILLDDKSIEGVPSGYIGYISQNPDNQIVCDKVWSELAFGLESRGVAPEIIRARVAEICTIMGIESWFYKSTSELSGGEKQKLALAAVLVDHPAILVLDEPTSMLDPIAARAFWDTVFQIHHEYGLGLIITEHSYDYIIDQVDSIYRIQDRQMQQIERGDVHTRVEEISEKILGERISSRDDVRKQCTRRSVKTEPIIKPPHDIITTLRDIRHLYSGRICLNIDRLDIRGGVTVILGPNGAGKTTLARILTEKKRKGINGAVLVPQDVRDVFIKDNVRDELECIADITADIYPLVEPYLGRHPLDLSGGEQHIVAICKSILKKADMLVFDEPTRGLDRATSLIIEDLIRSIQCRAKIIITHDLEMAARMADEIIFMFGGQIASSGEPHDVLTRNLYFKPEITMIFDDIIRDEEVESGASDS